AQHRYDEAIAGFEAIIDNADCRADSVFAVIDAGTLHLEAQEWAQRDTVDRVRSVFGSRQELSPVSYEAHRKRTDELLAMLGGGEFAGRPTVPTEYFLRQNYPNPFNAVTRISYGLKEDVAVKVKVFDVLGREVITLVDAPQRAGYYTALWSGRNASGTSVGSGVYFCRIEAGAFNKSMKMTLVK
ncbi:MAG: T9SS type A sorting domain-containing protein, partial [Calditrichaeota bacterium]|nr:T9SS type A sorting domain-containing protein [Calditrichota bacterium]